MHIHIYINIHIFTQPAASVFADLYVGVKTHLCIADQFDALAQCEKFLGAGFHAALRS